MNICFTYQIVTPESAEHGDSAEHGWITPGHWEYALEDSDGYHGSILKEAMQGLYDVNDLREAIGFAESLGICEDSGSWLSSVDPDIDFSSGDNRYYSMHIAGVTPSTYNRIKRLLGAR